MSANTYWRPAHKGKSLPCLSGFLDVLMDALDQHGASEVSLSGSDIRVLRGMAAADKSLRETVDLLIEAIEKHETIYLWREY